MYSMISDPTFKNPSIASTPPLRFPQKLWKIANECQSGAVRWSPSGKSVLLRYSSFREEFMSTKNDFFKTDNISSFVRQLNLYGFRKIYDNADKQAYKENSDLHEFSNIFFQRDRPDLLDKVTRKSRVLTDIKNDLEPESEKSAEISNESLCDEGKNSIFFEKNDHSYLCIRSIKAGTLLYKKLNEHNIEKHHGVKKVQQLETSNPIKENVTPNISQHSNIEQQDSTTTLLPVKKKRGRKPGRKRNNNQIVKQQIYYSPTLQNPGTDFDLIFFKEKDDKVFLRHTSRDVMMSSTLPFRETPEYLILKEMHNRMPHQKKRMKPSLSEPLG